MDHLWSQLCTVTYRKNPMSTSDFLQELLRASLQGSNEDYTMKLRTDFGLWLTAFRRDKKRFRDERMKIAHDIASVVNTVLRQSSPIPKATIPTVKSELIHYYQLCYADSAVDDRQRQDVAKELKLLMGGRTKEVRENKDRDNAYRRLLREQNGFVNDVLSILMDEDNNVYSDDDTASPATRAVYVASSDAAATTAVISTTTAAPGVNTTTGGDEDNEDSLWLT